MDYTSNGTSKDMPKEKPSYVRQQKGHSIIKYVFLCLLVVGIPSAIYYTISPNHYWHA